MTLSSSPLALTVIRLEKGLPYSFSLHFVVADETLNATTPADVDITGAAIKMTAAAQPHLGGAVAFTVDAVLDDPANGYARIDLQAADTNITAGEYDFAITMLSAENYAATVVKGTIEIVANPETAWVAEEYLGEAVTQGLTIQLGNDSIKVTVNHLQAPTFSIGTVASVAYGNEPSAAFEGRYPHQILNLTIPAGQPGSDGADALVTDDAVRDFIVDETPSLTRAALDQLFAGVAYAELIDTGRLSVASLGAAYAAKSTQTTVETGRLSQANLDADYASLDTQTTVEEGRLSENTLLDTFAAHSVEEAVVSGRLNNAVLTGRFGLEKFSVGAGQMLAATGSPSSTPILNLVACWRFAQDVDNSVAFGRQMDESWATYDIVVRGCNLAATGGNVRLRVQHNSVAEGEDVTSGGTVGTIQTVAAGAQYELTRHVIRTNIAVVPGELTTFRVMRSGTDVEDTLNGEWALLEVELLVRNHAVFQPQVEDDEEGALDGVAFTEVEDALLDVRVFVNAAPPDDDDEPNYKYRPLTDAATQQNYSDSTWSEGNKWTFLWAYRYNYDDAHNKKSNPIPPGPGGVTMLDGQECRIVYTTKAKAMAATQSTIRHLLGLPLADVRAPWNAAGGVNGDLVAEATMRASLGTYFDTQWTYNGETSIVAVDKVYLHTDKWTAGTHPELNLGVVLDYEVQDNRTPAETLAHLEDLAADLHAAGKQLFVYTNPFHASGQQYTGLDDTNLPDVIAAVDFIGPQLWVGNNVGSIPDSWDASMALCGTLDATSWAKIVPIFELGDPGTSLEDAEWMYDKLHEPGDLHPSAVMFWRHGATVGGDPLRLTNQKIRMVTLGEALP